MKKNAFREKSSFLMVAGLLLAMVFAVTCGGGGGSPSSTGTGTVNTSISDPPTCKSPSGPFDNVWVTITRVRAHISNDAAPNDNGWIDLVDLRNAPRQIDLLNLDSTTCVLTQLSSTSGLPAGQYQQIRLYLLSNSPGAGEVTPSAGENRCGTAGYNCVVSGATTTTLNLSSEAQTGIKIPSGQIAGGKFTVSAGQATDLNIDFDACASIVQQGNGQFRLKPVLHAGEVSLNNNSISGRVVEMVNGASVPISNAMVLVEQRDPQNSNLDRVIMQKTTGQDGRFIFCPLPTGTGTYDIVAAATNTSTTYNATVTLAVPLGTNMGDIPLVPEAGGITPARIDGRITSTPNPVDISLSALQEAVGGSNPLIVTIPLFANSTPMETTATGGTCAAGTTCADYTLYVPASNPQVGTFSVTHPTPYAAPAPAPVYYWVNAQAFVPGSGATPDCTPPSMPVTFDAATRIAVTVVGITTQNFSFTGCDGSVP